MPEFPKIARERLDAQQAAAGLHPDADLLAAFGEQALSPQEREQVLAHLAACADCRQVVALAFPAVEHPAPSAEDSRAWHEWWVFRWAGLAAALTVIVIAVYVARPHPRMGQEAAAPEKAAEPAAMPPIAAPVPATPAAPAEQKPAPRQERPRKFDKNVAGASGAGPRADSSVAVRPQAPAVNAPPPVMADQSVEIQTPAAAPGANAEKAQSEYASKAADSMKSQPPKAPMPNEAVGGMLARSSPAPLAKTRKIAAMTRWSISESGALQRSDDGGRTWTDVDVAGATGFRTVAAMGAEVWAGGAHGALFHSRDAGDHWTRIVVGAAARPVTADISRIEPTDARTVAVVTSTGEKWVTADGGATWRLTAEAH